MIRYDGSDGSANLQEGVFSKSIKSGKKTWQGEGGSNVRVDFRFNGTPSGSISNTGSGKAFSILPPYITVYCWKRTQ